MKSFFQNLDELLVVFIAILFLCINSATAETPVGGTIDIDTTWNAAGSPYVAIENISVPSGVTLSIAPGVTVYMDGYGMDIYGTLDAVGISGDPILFSSSYAVPEPGDWSRIYFEAPSSENLLEYCEIEFAGMGMVAALLFEDVPAEINHCNIHNCLGGAIDLNCPSPSIIQNTDISEMGNIGIYISSNNPSTIITGNTISNCNGYPIFGFGDFRDNVGLNNAIDAIYLPNIPLQGTLDSSNEFVYASDGFTVDASTTLDIEPGVIIKMESGSITASGIMTANGTNDDQITFTSWKDDTIGGDTYHDGSTTQPAPGDWTGITLQSQSYASTFQFFRGRYAGANEAPILTCIGQDPSVVDSVFDHSASDGIFLGGAGRNLVENTVVLDCSGDAFTLMDAPENGIHSADQAQRSYLYIINCLAAGNTGAGLVCTSGLIINLTSTNNDGCGISTTGSPTIQNSIIWNNSSGSVNGGSPVIEYSDVQGGWGGAGEENIDEDPLFIIGFDGEYYLDCDGPPESPCIDAGSDPAADICLNWNTYCLDSLTTSMYEDPDESTVDLGYHYYSDFVPPPTISPTKTPTSTFTPTATPIPPTCTEIPATPTPNCGELGVTIWMPTEYYTSGMICSCHATVCNPDDTALSGYPLFVILDVGGMYFFAPDFSEFNYYQQDYPPGESRIDVLPEFSWPNDAGSASGIMWYGAMTDPTITELFGGLGTFTFGWGE